MWSDEPSPIGNGGAEIGYLKWRERHLSLSDGDTDDTQCVPVAFECLVVICGIGNHAAFLIGKVHAKFVAEPHTLHIVSPGIHGNLQCGIFVTVVEHVVESPAKEAIAGGSYSRNQVEWGWMPVASHFHASCYKSTVAGIFCGGVNHSLREKGEGLAGLKSRSRRILSHDGAVEQWF